LQDDHHFFQQSAAFTTVKLRWVDVFAQHRRFINHTDQELALIETLVGRTSPFVLPKDS
jgi:hypothetical protein